ncbi:hypothetical protein Mmah_1304 [Methanohalophilus mahii DSM 5219]|uniref:DUF4405 domain-containing protein n=1 Tax=Methanohalophilus mahii (strain ATCC 35705 / DSM 5219 / SLP) TaxID=547558 RepID=D5E6L7_METMS|nr:hypothetical protein Mmah_1304 [Methanohalophilus mahii DSM 5219]
MKKLTFNFLIETLMFLDLMLLVGIGLSLLLKMHLFGDIHLYLGLVLFGLILVHIYLHWNSVMKMYQRTVNDPRKRKIYGVIYIFACLVLLIGIIIHHLIYPN